MALGDSGIRSKLNAYNDALNEDVSRASIVHRGRGFHAPV
jgi:hypothetical protein